MEIKREKDRLCATYGQMLLPLKHKSGDIFYANFGPIFFGSDSLTDFTFLLHTSGDISALSIPLEIDVKPIIFQKL